ERRYIVGQLGQWEGRRDRLNAVGREPRNNTRPARSVSPAAVGQHNNHVAPRHLLLLTSRLCAGSGQPSVFIQLATACPISSGESSWTKGIALTVNSVRFGQERTAATSFALVRIAPGSTLNQSFGNLLVASQSE